MSEHECQFPEERTPEGTLLLLPCLLCGFSAADALIVLNEKLERAQRRINEANRDVIDVHRRLTEEREKAAGWRCFHCGFVFVEAAEARQHFGGKSSDTPACLKADR